MICGIIMIDGTGDDEIKTLLYKESDCRSPSYDLRRTPVVLAIVSTAGFRF